MVSATVPLTGSVIATTNLSHDAFPDGRTLSFVPVVQAKVGTTTPCCLYCWKTSLLASSEGDVFVSSANIISTIFSDGYRSGKGLTLDSLSSNGHRKIGETRSLRRVRKALGDQACLACCL